MNVRLLRSLVGDMDEEDLIQLFDEIDMVQVLRELGPLLERELQPHIDDIRERAQSADNEAIRNVLSEMPEEQQQEVFDETVADLVVVLRECLEQPDVGLPKLKSRFRDPEAFEPLLLIFEDDVTPPDELKDFAAMTVRWAAAQIFPEMYSEQELAELEDELTGR